MVLTDKILEVALGAKIGAAKFMTRYDVHQISVQTVGTILERSFTMITIQLVNYASLKFFTTCALATSCTRDGKQGHLGQGSNRRGG
jgi:hypothetical protein